MCRGLTEEELYVEAGLVTVALLSWCQHAVTVQDGTGRNAASASQPFAKPFFFFFASIS